MPDTNHKKPAFNYAKYTGMAFQMFAYAAVGFFVGRYFDKKLGHESLVLAALGALCLLVAYLIKIVIDLMKS